MPTKTMTATGLVILSPNTYRLNGSGQLVSITVTKDTNGAPPDPGKASGSVGPSSANVSAASVQVWNELHAKLASFPFTAMVDFTGSSSNGSVTDLRFGNASNAGATRRKIAEDVEALRFLAERLAEKFVPEVFCEESPTGVRRGLAQGEREAM